MRIIEFPGRKKQKNRNHLGDGDKKKMVDQFSKMLDDTTLLNPAEVDLSEINLELFVRYIEEFDCFVGYEGSTEPRALLLAYHGNSGSLDESQELVVEFVFELLSELDLGFVLSDAFAVWPKNDMAAFQRILTIHSFFYYEFDGNLDEQ